MRSLRDESSPQYEQAIHDAKKLLRYAVARWGYSTNVAAWEYFNEMDPGLPTGRFYAELGEYLEQIDVYGHLRCTSTWGPSVKDCRHCELDVAQVLLDPKWKLSPVDRKTGSFRYDYDVTPWEELKDTAREERRMEVYAAMVDRMDQGIGRLLDALDETGVAENTVVFFLSDNGGCASWPRDETGFKEYNRGIPVGDPRGYEFVGPGWGWAQNAPFRRHKVWTYEGGIATPLIARWPGVVRPGAITHQVGHVIDFMPPLVELADGTYPETSDPQARPGQASGQNPAGEAITPLERESLVPILRGPNRRPHEALCWALCGNRAIGQGDWKLVWGASDKRWELYDLAARRTETNDPAAKHPGRVAAMAAEWQRWAAKCEVTP